METITESLINQAADGDMEAFEEIYKSACGFVYNVAYRVVGNQEDAEEVTQDVFVTVHRKLHTFRFDASFKTWIYRITTNMAINQAKKANKHKNRRLTFDEAYITQEGTNEGNESAQRQYDKKVAEKLLDSLNPDQRACLVLRSLEGLSYQEIAKVLGININTVRTRIKRGREYLLKIKDEVMSNAM